MSQTVIDQFPIFISLKEVLLPNKKWEILFADEFVYLAKKAKQSEDLTKSILSFIQKNMTEEHFLEYLSKSIEKALKEADNFVDEYQIIPDKEVTDKETDRYIYCWWVGFIARHFSNICSSSQYFASISEEKILAKKEKEMLSEIRKDPTRKNFFWNYRDDLDSARDDTKVNSSLPSLNLLPMLPPTLFKMRNLFVLEVIEQVVKLVLEDIKKSE